MSSGRKNEFCYKNTNLTKQKNTKKKCKKKNNGQNFLKTMAIVFSVVMVLFVVIFGGVYLLIKHYIGLTNFINDDEVYTVADHELESVLTGDTEDDVYYVEQQETDENGNVTGTVYVARKTDELSAEELASIEAAKNENQGKIEEAQQAAASIPLSASGDVYNLLLIGVDVRAGAEWNGNSDSMILISINNSKKTIYMTSFMRDLYANIPGVGTYKLNRAHAVGGGPLLVQTIEDNYRIKIDNYASVNFYSFIEIIDSIGGLDLEITAEEVPYVNKYIEVMCREAGGISPDAYYVAAAGYQHLNGMQAVAYARVRYVGTDFARTERQRKVLNLIFEKLKNSSITEVNTFLNAALPKVTHNLSDDTVMTLIMNAPTYLGYDLVTNRVPFDNMYTYYGEMLVPDFEATIDILKNIIY